MPRPRSAPDPYLLSKVGTLYYLRNLTQQEIADRLRISRPTISRLLQEARNQGIVQISIAPPRGLHLELESQLEERFGLGEALIVDVESENSTELLRQIGAAAAGYLSRTIQSGDTIGLAWGATLNAMVQAMPFQPTDGVRVVQTLGGIGPPDAEEYAAGLVRRLAQALSGAPVLLPAPGVVATVAVRNVLRDDPHVRAALRYLDTLDTVFLGIGSLKSNPVLSDGHSLPRGTPQKLAASGAVGDIALRFFNAKGDSVRTPLDDRVLGITVDQLRKAARVVAVAGGPKKIDAIYSALHTDIIDVLVTDQRTAKALMSRKP
jgi:DNA-binding transcriptional regulator LsrR (DeoR family)